MRLNRRTLMKAIGASAMTGAMPFLLSGERARAGGAGGIPKRIVFIYIQSGAMPGRWEPTGRGGGGTPTETEWDVNMDLHGALAPYRDDISYFENLDFISEYDDPTEPANAHVQGGTHAMSAAHRLSSGAVGGITIDQAIANAINSPAPVTLIPSLEMGWAPSGESFVSAQRAGSPLPRQTNPVTVYNRLFPDAGTDPGDREAEALRRARAFELVRARYDALAPRLSGAERAKVEQQQQTVVDLERRLTLADSRVAEAPPRTILGPLSGMRTDHPDYYRTALDIDITLIAAALHTDATRVITLELSDAPNNEIGYTPGRWGTSDAHDLIHRVMHLTGGDSLSRDPAAIEVIRQQHLRGMSWVARLIDELALRTETDGQRLLDHTVVVYCSQIADGSHCLQSMPWLTAGSCGGALRTGRYFRQSRDRSREPRRWISPRYQGAGRSHSDLFVSLANAMDVPMTTFGHAPACTGPIPGFNV